MLKRYRTKQETIEYFQYLAASFELDARRENISKEEKAYLKGKADAYYIAWFELTHNMK